MQTQLRVRALSDKAVLLATSITTYGIKNQEAGLRAWVTSAGFTFIPPKPKNPLRSQSKPERVLA